MPHPDLCAIRDCVDLQDRAAHRFVAYAALDDIASRNRLRWQWTHQHAARLLGVPEAFTSMVANYLDYRRNQRNIGTERGIRPWGAQGAQLFLYDERQTPLDLLNLNTSGDRTEQMARLLMEATYRRVRVEPEAVKQVEAMLGRACGLAWPSVVATHQRQYRSQNGPVVSWAVTTGVRAA